MDDFRHQQDFVLAVEVGGLDGVLESVVPVDAFRVVVDREPVWPADLLVDEDLAPRPVQVRALDLRLVAPVRPEEKAGTKARGETDESSVAENANNHSCL